MLYKCSSNRTTKKNKIIEVLDFTVFLSGFKILDGNLASINKEAQQISDSVPSTINPVQEWFLFTV